MEILSIGLGNERIEMKDEALRLALEALEANLANWNAKRKAMPIIKQALEQPEQKPVSYETVYETIIQWDESDGKRSRRELTRRIVALYTSPPKREPLTDEEVKSFLGGDAYGATIHDIRAIEAKLKEKNT